MSARTRYLDGAKLVSSVQMARWMARSARTRRQGTRAVRYLMGRHQRWVRSSSFRGYRILQHRVPIGRAT